jgi:hypothetical protein
MYCTAIFFSLNKGSENWFLIFLKELRELIVLHRYKLNQKKLGLRLGFGSSAAKLFAAILLPYISRWIHLLLFRFG